MRQTTLKETAPTRAAGFQRDAGAAAFAPTGIKCANEWKRWPEGQRL